MLHDLQAAAVIRERLDIGQLLDESAAVSFMERVAFRLELLRILDDFDHARQGSDDVLHCLANLHSRVLDVVNTG